MCFYDTYQTKKGSMRISRALRWTASPWTPCWARWREAPSGVGRCGYCKGSCGGRTSSVAWSEDMVVVWWSNGIYTRNLGCNPPKIAIFKGKSVSKFNFCWSYIEFRGCRGYGGNEVPKLLGNIGTRYAHLTNTAVVGIQPPPQRERSSGPIAVSFHQTWRCLTPVLRLQHCHAGVCWKWAPQAANCEGQTFWSWVLDPLGYRHARNHVPYADAIFQNIQVGI